MSIERDTKTLVGISEGVLTPEQKAAETKAERRARLVHILDRGHMHDRMKVDLPPHLHGEWARNKQEDIFYMQSLGFDIDREHATKRAINSNASAGDGVVVGDVIFMTCPKDVKEEIDAIRQEQMFAKSGRPGDNIGREEKEFQALTAISSGGEIPTMVESKTRAVTASEVATAVAEADRQIKPIT